MRSETLERARALELSEEVNATVEQLWAAGKGSLVLRLLLEDCNRLLRAVRPTSESEAKEFAELEELCQRGEALGVPSLEREFGATHGELLGQLAIWRRRCVAQLRGSRTRRRQRTWGAALALVLGVVGVSFFVFRNAPTASASATYSRDVPASLAIDGLDKTEWLLPDRETGWLELEYARPRAIETVIIVNGSNKQYLDRGAKAVKLEAFGRGRLLATARGELPPIAKRAEPHAFPLAARDVTKVRITVESFYGLGGGLAEVSVP